MQMTRSCTSIACQKNLMHSPCFWCMFRRAMCIEEVKETKIEQQKNRVYVVVNKTTSKTLSACALHVGGTTIQPTSGARNLRVFFDSHLQ